MTAEKRNRGFFMNIGSQMEWHPAANIFPMMSDDEVQALADDIRENGQRVPISRGLAEQNH